MDFNLGPKRRNDVAEGAQYDHDARLRKCRPHRRNRLRCGPERIAAAHRDENVLDSTHGTTTGLSRGQERLTQEDEAGTHQQSGGRCDEVGVVGGRDSKIRVDDDLACKSSIGEVIDGQPKRGEVPSRI